MGLLGLLAGVAILWGVLVITYAEAFLLSTTSLVFNGCFSLGYISTSDPLWSSNKQDVFLLLLARFSD